MTPYGGLDLDSIPEGETNYLRMASLDGSALAEEVSPLVGPRYRTEGGSNDIDPDIPTVYITGEKLAPEVKAAQIAEIRGAIEVPEGYADAGDRERY